MRLIRIFFADILLFLFMFVGFNYILQNSGNISYAWLNLESQIQSGALSNLSFGSSANVSDSSPSSAADISAVVAAAKPAIVSIYGTQKVATSPFSYYTKIDAGTGFFIDSDGYIVTNRHVVASDNAVYTVSLGDGKKKAASVVYRDPDNDIAVLKIDGSNYPVLDFGDSSKLKVGQTIVGIGNAYGKYAGTVSSGAVSGLHKSVVTVGDTSQKIDNVIQISAQLYPGDSGGPLLDMNGKVVGVNVAIAAERDNVSFSIPINDVRPIIKNLAMAQ